MWLWKKFWNTDIIGKIYILIILFIVVVATITVITRYKNADSLQTSNASTNEIIKENMVESKIESKTEEIISQNIKEEKEDIQIQETPKTTATSSKDTQEQVAVVEKKVEDKNTKVKEENKTIEDKKDTIKETKEEVQEIKQEEQLTEKVGESNNNQAIDKKEETKLENKTETKIEEYKQNTEMINRMKTFIQNNPSDNMKEYGFNVIVDSSIVDLTNQFTYTDQRMKNQLTLRCGTIKIYARDYYYNGNLVMTECFIL